MEKIKGRDFNILSWTIMLIPIFWVLGVKFIFFQVCALCIFILNIRNEKLLENYKNNKEVKLFTIFICGFLLCNIIAIIINPLNLQISEFISSLYHLSYWISGGILVIFIANTNDDISSFKLIKNAVYVLVIWQVIIYFISLIQWVSGDIWSERHGILYNMFGGFSGNNFLSEVTSINLSYVDWVNDTFKYRFNGFYMYPATAGITTLYILCYFWDFNKLKGKKNIIVKYSIIIILCICIYFTKSRMVYLCIVTGLCITGMLSIVNKRNIKYVFYTAIIITVFVIIIILSFDIVNKVILSRPASSSDRFNTYIYGIKTAMKYPFFGVGDKFAVDGIYLLIGSHSTYINILVKSGFTGLFFIICSLCLVIRRIIINKKSIGCVKSRNLWFTTSFLFLTTCIWMMTEEIDWPQITAFFFFMNIGIIFSFKRIVYILNKRAYENIKICFPTSSGGHLTHLLQIKDVWKKSERVWVTFKKIDAESALEGEKVYWCYYPTNRNFKNLIKNTFLAIKIIYKERPDIIISTGAAPAIPFYYIGKIFGAKLIYIEVYDRVDLPTVTGKIVYPICDEFIIQWEEQRQHYKHSKLLGGIF